jgi:hypothetical protein
LSVCQKRFNKLKHWEGFRDGQSFDWQKDRKVIMDGVQNFDGPTIEAEDQAVVPLFELSFLTKSQKLTSV